MVLYPQMSKKLLSIVGVLLLLFSIFLGSKILQAEQQAAKLNDTEKSYGMIDDTIPMCNWEAQPPEKVMNEDKSQAILINTSNPTDKTCETYLSLRAPGFDISPSKEEQKITVPAQGKGSVSWVITPDKTGTFVVTISDTLNTKIFGITVTNIFGLNAFYAKILSALGGLFGPMLTVPWWWDRIKGRKQKKEQSKEDSQTTENTNA